MSDKSILRTWYTIEQMRCDGFYVVIQSADNGWGCIFYNLNSEKQGIGAAAEDTLPKAVESAEILARRECED